MKGFLVYQGEHDELPTACDQDDLKAAPPWWPEFFVSAIVFWVEVAAVGDAFEISYHLAGQKFYLKVVCTTLDFWSERE